MDDIEQILSTLESGSEPLDKTEPEEKSFSSGKKVPEELLHTNPNTGLSTAEVTKRSKQFGENELSEKKEHRFLKFLLYFIGPVQYVMISSAILAGALQHWIELGVISFLLILNAIIGWFQEYKAGNVVAELRKTVASHTKVLRNGVIFEILAIEIVPGDIVPLEEGYTVPADGRIVNSGFLQVDQSPLTGESLTVEKRINDVIYSSSVVKRGEALMIVTSIGDNTYVGVTASLVAGTSKVGHFQQVLTQIATVLLVAVVIFITIIWISGFFRALAFSELLLYTLIITVIGVPVGLPAVVTTTMVVGTAELARKRVVVQKLAAIESLAGVDILCSDKTGTLTQNKLTMGTPYVVPGESIDDLLLTSVLASSRKIKGLDPIDRTIILSLKNYPMVKDSVKHFKTLAFLPFDPVGKKVTSTVEDENGEKFICVKGAPGAVLSMVQEASEHGSDSDESESRTESLDPLIVEEYNKKVAEFASRGFRSLGVARKRNGDPWKLLGILQLFDPPRYDTSETIQEAKELGLEIKMLTGDAVGIAAETSRQLNLGNKVYSIKQLIAPESGQKLTGSEFNAFVEAADGFAEVFPQHKYMVVDILQKRGHLVAMTGDGMNDAPSLKKADTGIAVEGASEAARAAADIIFLNAGLSTIIDALKTARKIFHRMRAYVVYRIALSVHLCVFLTSTIVILNKSISSELIVFLAIFADIATLSIAYDNATFSQKPTKWNLPNLWGTSIVLGLCLVAGTWIIYATTMLGPRGGIFNTGGDNAGSILFLEIALTQNWLIIITRCNGAFWSSRPSWQLLGAVIIVDIIATLFTYFGWFSGGSGVNVVTILKIWIYSIGIFTILALLHNWFNSSLIFNRMMKQNDGLPEDLEYDLERMARLHKNSSNGERNSKNGNGYHTNGNGYHTNGSK